MASSVRGRRPADPGPTRLPALDGLRGVAALVVVVHHGLLTWPVLADQYLAENRASGSWWLAFTPLHLVWAGTEAVMVFFVLSGLVLALPFLEGRRRPGRWRGYYGQRLLRLYLPAVAALGLSAVVVHLFPRVPGPTTSWWFDAHVLPVTRSGLAGDALRLDGSGGVNTVLWSLHWELLFSLLLPAFLLLARRPGGRAGWPTALALLALAGAGVAEASPALTWLPLFGLGVVLAGRRRELQQLGARIAGSRYAAACWSALTAGAVVLLLAEWWTRPLHLAAPTGLTRIGSAAGAVLLCALCLTCPSAGVLLGRRPVQWLGRVSFSLYLVHEPVLVSVSSVVGGSRTGVVLTLAVGVPVSLLLAVAFHRVVEAPGQRLARAVGGRLRALGAPAEPAPTVPAALPLPTRPIAVPRLVPPRVQRAEEVVAAGRGLRATTGAG